MTRLAILMPLASPWSRRVALGLAAIGNEVYAIDPGEDRATASFVRATDPHQAGDITALSDRIAATHRLNTRFPGAWRYLAATPELRTLLPRIKPDVLLALYGGGLAALAWVSGFRPFAVYVVGSDVTSTRGVRRLVTRLALRSAAHVFVNGLYLHALTERVAPEATSTALYIGVDLTAFTPGLKQLDGLIRIVCTRGFLSVYNNEHLIRALALLPKDMPGIRVIFTSGGPLLQAAQRLAREILPDDRQACVAFLGGVSDEEMRQTLANADIYVSVSRSDGTSISLLEAMASGAYPILSDIPPNREWQDQAANNLALVPLDRPDLIAKALTRVVRDHQLRAVAAGMNRLLVASRADSKVCMETLSIQLAQVANLHRQQILS